MPLPARAKRPRWSEMAPVKAPFTWPKSSDSRRVGAKAVQLTGTNGSDASEELKWMARATTSFPVPVSPRTARFPEGVRSGGWILGIF